MQLLGKLPNAALRPPRSIFRCFDCDNVVSDHG